MPVRFTWGEKDLLFGKTENTMVLPEYRRKILYPRFEKKFAAAYEARYHALFSTMGPPAAIRQRKALGYTATESWLYLERASRAWGSVAFALSRSRSRFGKRILQAIARPVRRMRLPEGVQILTPGEAKDEVFFDSYWSRARENWGIAPRRDKEDLSWRYWDNPYSPHYALIVRHPRLGDALMVIEAHGPGTVSIEDISMQRPSSELLNFAIEAGLDAVRKRFGAKLITALVTSDAFPGKMMPVIAAHFRPSWLSRFRKMESISRLRLMPRKITPLGQSIGLEPAPWNVTLIVSEGRR
jgi:hypothetical protein